MRTSTQTESQDFIVVTILELGKDPIAVTLDTSDDQEYTVADVQEKAFGEVVANTVKVKGEEYGLDSIVDDGDRLVIATKVKGGLI